MEENYDDNELQQLIDFYNEKVDMTYSEYQEKIDEAWHNGYACKASSSFGNGLVVGLFSGLLIVGSAVIIGVIEESKANKKKPQNEVIIDEES